MIATAVAVYAREDMAKRLHYAKVIRISRNGEPIYLNRHSGKNAKLLASLRNRLTPIGLPGKEARKVRASLKALRLRLETSSPKTTPSAQKATQAHLS
jgi:hypothetical protein